MDGAADRLDLRGLHLLARCRTLRRDEAGRLRADADRAVDAARAAAEAAAERLAAHQRAWRNAEAASLAQMAGHTLDGTRFRRMRDALDALADTAIRLGREADAAREHVAEAERARDAAKQGLAAAQRRLDQSDSIHGRVSASRAARHALAEEQELDDDLAQRYGRAR